MSAEGGGHHGAPPERLIPKLTLEDSGPMVLHDLQKGFFPFIVVLDLALGTSHDSHPDAQHH